MDLNLTDCRPEVLAFALLMERELRANAAKGGWRGDDAVILAQRSVQEAKELVGAVVALDQKPNPRLAQSLVPNIAEEAADTANMAMMAADVCGALPAFTRPFDLALHLHRQRAFSERTFGPGARTNGVIDHIRKELREIKANPTDITEWVDVIILAFDGAWRAGWEPDAIIQAFVEKQTRNEARSWPDWRTADPNAAIEHIRTGKEA